MYYHQINPKPIRLKRDILVYKATYLTTHIETCFNAMYHNVQYKKGLCYEEVINFRNPTEYEKTLLKRKYNFYNSYHSIHGYKICDSGFHSYGVAPESRSNIFKGGYSHITQLVVGDFVIPKGSNIYVNEQINEIVSDLIIYTGEFKLIY